MTGSFSQSQLSESAQDFYQLARSGLKLETLWSETREIIHEIESRLISARSLKNLEAIRHLQHKVEWAEVFIIGVYALEATHILLHGLGHDHGFVVSMLLLSVIVCGPVVAYFVLRPDKEHNPFRWWWLLLLLAGWVVMVACTHFGIWEPASHPSPEVLENAEVQH
ncbi:hypothetical protein GC197_13610 [bacterium]|nr:hypothetical protein [bacterium]